MICGVLLTVYCVLKEKARFSASLFELLYLSILPDEVIIDGFSSVNEDALSRAERIDHG